MHDDRVRRISFRQSRRRTAMFVVLICAAAPAVAAAQAPIAVLAGMSASASSLRDSIVALARAQIGTRYRHGGGPPTPRVGFIGLVPYLVSRLQMGLSPTA